MGNALESLLQSPFIWRGNQYARVAFESIPTGFQDLDAQLPGGGWPRAALTEILADQQGIGEFSVLMPALARLSAEKDWIVLVAPPHIPYAPALAGKCIDLSKIIIVNAVSEQESVWAAERCLRSKSCSAVVLWAGTQTHRAYRRLQLAAEAGQAWGVVFGSSACARHPSPAALRLMLAPDQGRLKIHLLKRRGGGGLPEIFLAGDGDRTGDKASAPPALTHARWRQSVA
ncbi:MAG: translesion DNA synthesis-associated protein ImuA [Burkholderiales bacterium]